MPLGLFRTSRHRRTLASFQQTFDTPGVVYTALPHRDDVRAAIDEFGLVNGCEKFRVEPYDDGVFVGLAQVGTACGTARTASWMLVIANPADQAFTAGVQVQSATAADEDAVEMVLQSFNRVESPGVPDSAPVDAGAPGVSIPGVSVPAGLGPLEVATMFLDALAAGDGATACALLTVEEMTINFVEEAETCAAELSLAGRRPGRVLGERADHRRREHVVAGPVRRRGPHR